MASTNEVFGQIGAAKIFAGGVSNALGKQTNVSNSWTFCKPYWGCKICY